MSIYMSLHKIHQLSFDSITCLGTGILGFLAMIFNGNVFDIPRFIGLASIATVGLVGLLNLREKNQPNEHQLVLITGCDSGLGYTMAIKCHSIGMTVLAGVLNLRSEGAMKLRDMFTSDRFHLVDIDIRKEDSIILALKCVDELLQRNLKNKLYALINNAGVMNFGEFEWNTLSLIEKQINVNLLGTMKITHQFLPMLRKYNGRVITVTSHCGLQGLPGLSIYSATKGGLHLWTDTLRMEMKKYNVDVINFIPGSFVVFSNIALNQQENAIEMRRSFTPDQLRFYGEYFDRYNNYLKLIPIQKSPQQINDYGLMNTFLMALLDDNPKSIYKYEPLRYTIYHLLFRITPTILRDILISKFISMPEYKPSKEFNIKDDVDDDVIREKEKLEMELI